MARLNINPTRMELLNLKRRTKTAVRGHKLLREKMDGLMKEFMATVHQVRELRAVAKKKLGSVFIRQFFASTTAMSEAVRSALAFPDGKISLRTTTTKVMGVAIPQFALEKSGTVKNYGFFGTPAELDAALDALDDAFPTLIELAETEKRLENVALELERTRRRVNALEHKLIPDLQETQKFIVGKLAESERSAIVATMRMK